VREKRKLSEKYHVRKVKAEPKRFWQVAPPKMPRFHPFESPCGVTGAAYGNVIEMMTSLEYLISLIALLAVSCHSGLENLSVAHA